MSNENYKLKLAEIDAKIEIYRYKIDLIKHIISVVGVIFALKISFSGLEPLIKSNADSITALAGLVEKINISNIFGYILSGFFGIGLVLERNGKKRAIKEKTNYQKQLEEGDLYRSSSNLTVAGDTPKKKPRTRKTPIKKEIGND